MPIPEFALRHPVHRFSHHEIDFRRRVLVMAVVNRTPDSFYDAGSTFALDAAVHACRNAVAAGAEWVDIGGVPFAPGAELAPNEEAERVAPVVAAVRADPGALGRSIVSVDTFQPVVARAALTAGADVVNDTTGLFYPELAAVSAEAGAHLVITHSLAHHHGPRTVVPRPTYADVVDEVKAFLEATVDRAIEAGVAEDKILVDPGHDLNKNTRDSLLLTRRLDEIAALGFPVLAAVSNKDFVGETLGQPKSRRLAGSLAAATLCASLGARVLRMHQAEPAVSAARLFEAVMGWREPVSTVHNMGALNPDPDRGEIAADPEWEGQQ
ncbi:MAG: dihydropteroate synthase [Micrococcus sp.]|nr:dihydropteroate synthase [Micrococcus sp.]